MVCYSAFLLTELDFIAGIQSVGLYEWIVYIHLLGDILEQYRHVVNTITTINICVYIPGHTHSGIKESAG